MGKSVQVYKVSKQVTAMETIWRFKGFFLVRWQNFAHNPWNSGTTPQNVWRLSYEGSTWELSFKIGSV